MRIAVDIRSLLEPFPSGVSEYTYQLVKNLVAQDQENEYLLFYNSKKGRLPERVKSLSGNKIKLIARHWPNKLFNGSLFFFAWPKLDRLLENVDLFFMPNLNFCAFSSGCKMVVTIHDLSFLYPGF